MTRASIKAYWTDKGVVPRWQLLGAYIGIMGAFAFGFANERNDAQQTKDAIIADCQKQNNINKTTKATLIAAAEKDIAKAEATARERGEIPELFKKEIEGRRDVTLALIDALAPVADCDNLIKE